MSRAQGDGYRTETNEGLNKYYDTVFLPALVKMIDEKAKKYHVGDFIIVCESSNVVDRIGYKLKSLKVVGQEYIIRVYMDDQYKTGISITVDSTNDKDEANRMFKEKVQMCKNCMM